MAVDLARLHCNGRTLGYNKSCCCASPWIILFSLFICCMHIPVTESTAQVYINFWTYNNIDLVANKSCCSTEFLDGECASVCNYTIQVCFGNNVSLPCDISRINLGYFGLQKMPLNSSDFVASPVQFGFAKWQGSVLVTIYVNDTETDRLVDFLQLPLSKSSPLTRQIKSTDYTQFNLTGNVSSQPSLMTLSVAVTCDRYFYTNTCDVYCQDSDSCSGHYTCEPVTGDRICISGWAGPYCNISLAGDVKCSDEDSSTSTGKVFASTDDQQAKVLNPAQDVLEFSNTERSTTQTSESTAQTSESTAQTSASTAHTSESTAHTSESTAQTSESTPASFRLEAADTLSVVSTLGYTMADISEVQSPEPEPLFARDVQIAADLADMLAEESNNVHVAKPTELVPTWEASLSTFSAIDHTSTGESTQSSTKEIHTSIQSPHGSLSSSGIEIINREATVRIPDLVVTFSFDDAMPTFSAKENTLKDTAWLDAERQTQIPDSDHRVSPTETEHGAIARGNSEVWTFSETREGPTILSLTEIDSTFKTDVYQVISTSEITVSPGDAEILVSDTSTTEFTTFGIDAVTFIEPTRVIGITTIKVENTANLGSEFDWSTSHPDQISRDVSTVLATAVNLTQDSMLAALSTSDNSILLSKTIISPSFIREDYLSTVITTSSDSESYSLSNPDNILQGNDNSKVTAELSFIQTTIYTPSSTDQWKSFMAFSSPSPPPAPEITPASTEYSTTLLAYNDLSIEAGSNEHNTASQHQEVRETINDSEINTTRIRHGVDYSAESVSGTKVMAVTEIWNSLTSLSTMSEAMASIISPSGVIEGSLSVLATLSPAVLNPSETAKDQYSMSALTFVIDGKMPISSLPPASDMWLSSNSATSATDKDSTQTSMTPGTRVANLTELLSLPTQVTQLTQSLLLPVSNTAKAWNTVTAGQTETTLPPLSPDSDTQLGKPSVSTIPGEWSPVSQAAEITNMFPSGTTEPQTTKQAVLNTTLPSATDIELLITTRILSVSEVQPSPTTNIPSLTEQQDSLTQLSEVSREIPLVLSSLSLTESPISVISALAVTERWDLGTRTGNITGTVSFVTPISGVSGTVSFVTSTPELAGASLFVTSMPELSGTPLFVTTISELTATASIVTRTPDLADTSSFVTFIPVETFVTSTQSALPLTPTPSLAGTVLFVTSTPELTDTMLFTTSTPIETFVTSTQSALSLTPTPGLAGTVSSVTSTPDSTDTMFFVTSTPVETFVTLTPVEPFVTSTQFALYLTPSPDLAGTVSFVTSTPDLTDTLLFVTLVSVVNDTLTFLTPTPDSLVSFPASTQIVSMFQSTPELTNTVPFVTVTTEENEAWTPFKPIPSITETWLHTSSTSGITAQSSVAEIWSSLTGYVSDALLFPSSSFSETGIWNSAISVTESIQSSTPVPAASYQLFSITPFTADTDMWAPVTAVGTSVPAVTERSSLITVPIVTVSFSLTSLGITLSSITPVLDVSVQSSLTPELSIDTRLPLTPIPELSLWSSLTSLHPITAWSSSVPAGTLWSTLALSLNATVWSSLTPLPIVTGWSSSVPTETIWPSLIQLPTVTTWSSSVPTETIWPSLIPLPTVTTWSSSVQAETVWPSLKPLQTVTTWSSSVQAETLWSSLTPLPSVTTWSSSVPAETLWWSLTPVPTATEWSSSVPAETLRSSLTPSLNATVWSSLTSLTDIITRTTLSLTPAVTTLWASASSLPLSASFTPESSSQPSLLPYTSLSIIFTPLESTQLTNSLYTSVVVTTTAIIPTFTAATPLVTMTTTTADTTTTTTSRPTPIMGEIFISGPVSPKDYSALQQIVRESLMAASQPACCNSVLVDENDAYFDVQGNLLVRLEYTFSPPAGLDPANVDRNTLIVQADRRLNTTEVFQVSGSRVYQGTIFGPDVVFSLDIAGEVTAEEYHQIEEAITVAWSQTHPACGCQYETNILNGRKYAGRYGLELTKTYYTVSRNGILQSTSAADKPALEDFLVAFNKSSVFFQLYPWTEAISYDLHFEAALAEVARLTSPAGVARHQALVTEWTRYLQENRQCMNETCHVTIRYGKPKEHYTNKSNEILTLIYFVTLNNTYIKPTVFSGPSLQGAGPSLVPCSCQSLPVLSVDLQGYVSYFKATLLITDIIGNESVIIHRNYSYDVSGNLVTQVVFKPANFETIIPARSREFLRALELEHEVKTLNSSTPFRRRYQLVLEGAVDSCTRKEMETLLKQAWTNNNKDLVTDDITVSIMKVDFESSVKTDGSPATVVDYTVRVGIFDASLTIVEAPSLSLLQDSLSSRENLTACECETRTVLNITATGTFEVGNGSFTPLEVALEEAWKKANEEYTGNITVRVLSVKPREAPPKSDVGGVTEETARKEEKIVRFIINPNEGEPGVTDLDMSVPAANEINEVFKRHNIDLTVIGQSESSKEYMFPWYIPAGVVLGVIIMAMMIYMFYRILEDQKNVEKDHESEDPKDFLENSENGNLNVQPVEFENTAISNRGARTSFSSIYGGIVDSEGHTQL